MLYATATGPWRPARGKPSFRHKRDSITLNRCGIFTPPPSNKNKIEAEPHDHNRRSAGIMVHSNHSHGAQDEMRAMHSVPKLTRRLSMVRIREYPTQKSTDFILQLPVELLIDVFSRLPVQDLIRLETVCKHFFKTLRNPENVDNFLVARQQVAKARLLEKVVRLTLRGFVDQEHVDFLDALSNFANRGGLFNDESVVSYLTAAMVDLFKLNLQNLPQHVRDRTSDAHLVGSMEMFIHYLLQVHITTHMPSSEMVCSVCKDYTRDTFMQAVSNNCAGLGYCGITESKILDWYRRLWSPVAKLNGIQSDGACQSRIPLLYIVSEVQPTPENLVTHLMWHTASREGPAAEPGIPVRPGICTMAKLAEKLDVPSLPSKTNFRDVGILLFIPNNGDCVVPAYFFAYYVRIAGALRLVNGALAGAVEVNTFVKTAIMEELDIY